MILEKLRLAPLFSKYNLVFWPRKSEQSKQAKKNDECKCEKFETENISNFSFFWKSTKKCFNGYMKFFLNRIKCGIVWHKENSSERVDCTRIMKKFHFSGRFFKNICRKLKKSKWLIFVTRKLTFLFKNSHYIIWYSSWTTFKNEFSKYPLK